MSYDISLEVDSIPVTVKRHAEGGTFAIGGTDQAYLNVTYNYATIFRFRDLNGMTASDTIDLMRSKVAELGTDTDNDYWNPTDGNVGHTLAILLGWAVQHPDAVWRVD
jgi:hypothetical protein